MPRPSTHYKESADKIAVWDISALYEEHWEDLFKQTMRILLDEDEAADVVQQTFLDLLEMKEKISGIKSIKSFLFIMSRNIAFKKLRRNLANTKYLNFYAGHYKEESAILEEWIVFKELNQMLQIEIDKLPAKMKEVFILSRNFDLSYIEIAQRLSISDKTVKKQISNAIKILRLKVDKRYQPLLLALVLTDILF